MQWLFSTSSSKDVGTKNGAEESSTGGDGPPPDEDDGDDDATAKEAEKKRLAAKAAKQQKKEEAEVGTSSACARARSFCRITLHTYTHTLFCSCGVSQPTAALKQKKNACTSISIHDFRI